MWARPIIVLLTVLVAGCEPEARPVVEDVDGTLKQLVLGLHAYYGANNRHYLDHGEFTASPAVLAEDPRWLPDSLVIKVRVAEDGQGWVGTITHVRVGPRAGCAMGWGDPLGIETPGGFPFTPGDSITCDAVFRDSNQFPGVAFAPDEPG